MRLILCLLCISLSVSSLAQKTVQYSMTKEELEVKKKEIQDEIKADEAYLEEIKNKKGYTLGELRVLQNKLAERQRLIGYINDEIGDIESNIKSSSREVVTLRQKLDLLKMRYAQSIRYAYETRSSYDMLAFLFSSHDFNDAMRRMKYLKKFRDFRKQQVEQIYATQTQLQHKIGMLNDQKERQKEKQQEELQQSDLLKQETDRQNQVMQQLKGQESELMKKIENNRKITNRINAAIQHYIQMEMERAQKAAAEAEAKRVAAEKAAAARVPAPPSGGNVSNVPTTEHPRPAPATGELMMTPTDIALASNFEGNKGKLYWPVDRGYISDHFGTHPHPVEKQVMINNDGVDIQTDQNAVVRSVFDGVVKRIFSITGSEQIVMIMHGNFFTVYNGLNDVSVKAGQQVTARQVIGHVGLNDENIPTINFQIWKSLGGKKGNTKLNPELWIAKPH